MRLALLLCVAALAASAADPDNGITAYKAGNYEAAIPLLQAANHPPEPVISAALLSALVYQGRVDEASDAAEADAAAFPNSPEVLAARGELSFYLGDIPETERLLKAALKLNANTPRAIYDLSRLYRMASMHHTARLLCLRAHEIDPEDALIMVDWLAYASPEKRKELIGPFVAAHPWFYKHFHEQEQTNADVRAELKEHKAFEPEGDRKETVLRLFAVMRDASHVRGVGLEMAIEGHRPLHLLFDTGASGILIKQSAVDKAGLDHLGSFEARGIGDKGARSAFAAIAESCSIGNLKYRHCVFRALEGKGNVGDEDGLIGADFFSDYIIDVDFQKLTLRLAPQPDRAPNPQGYDRSIPPGETGFTPVFRAGGHLLVLTTVNGKSTGLFLLDTGSATSMMDSTFARLSTKISGNPYLHVKGLSGEVKDVFEADKAELRFARFQQQNLGLISFNLNNSPEHQEFRMAGILGFPVLSMFRLTIDYRNGLVDFDYIFQKHR